MSVLELDGVSKSYGGETVVKSLSFGVERGLCVGLLGPNGAGKTTTMRVALGLVRPDGGRARALGLDMRTHALEARMRIGVVPQKDCLDPDFTVRENLRVFSTYFGIGPGEIGARMDGLLRFAGLEQRADSVIAHLSGGMQRRLTLARALVNDPELIFLDEPTTGLDPQARHLIWERLRDLKTRGKTLLLTTHFMEEAERLCDLVHIMDHGRVIATGPPHELIDEHIEPVVFEIYGPGVGDWLAAHPGLFSRVEQTGNLAYGYCADQSAALAALGGRHTTDLRHVCRPANLEDVFLKLTGRDLRE